MAALLGRKAAQWRRGISREDQAALDLHKILLEAMRAREGEILQFAAFLLPALGGVLAFPWLAQAQGKTVPCNTLLITTLTVISLLFFGGWYALALSYNYRYLKVVVSRLQNHLCLDRFQPKQWAQSWGERQERSPSGRLDRALFDFAPEVFRVLVLLFFVLILFVPVVFIFLGDKPWQSLYVPVAVGLATFLALGLLEWLGACHYPRKLEKLEDEPAAKSNPVSTPNKVMS